MNNGLLLRMEDKIREALLEDMTYGDISCSAVFREEKGAQADLICKEDGVLCGAAVFEMTFQLLDPRAHFETALRDGDPVHKGQTVGVVCGAVQALLSGERTALNFLQRMSGIATATRKMVKMLEGTDIRIADTRKTAPGLRVFDKYAVRVGGGINHRFNLSDCVMLKDNHISAAGGIGNAVRLAREHAPFTARIEVEAETLEQVQQAIDSGCDIIMLDNMDKERMAKALSMIGKKALVEVSGNVTADRIADLRDLDIDILSSGTLTHSVKALDFSLKNMRTI